MKIFENPHILAIEEIYKMYIAAGKGCLLSQIQYPVLRPGISQNANRKEIAADGTVWQKVEIGRSCGTQNVYTKLKDIAGPIDYVKRNIMLGYVKSAFQLIIDET